MDEQKKWFLDMETAGETTVKIFLKYFNAHNKKFCGLTTFYPVYKILFFLISSTLNLTLKLLSEFYFTC